MQELSAVNAKFSFHDDTLLTEHSCGESAASVLSCLQARIIAAERGIELDGQQPINPDKFLPAGLNALLLRDWTLSPGVRVRNASSSGGSSSSAAAGAGSSSSSSSSGSNLKYYVTLRKQPQVSWDGIN